MLDALTQRLSSVVKNLRGHSRLTEENIQDMVREVRLALLDADVGLPVVKDFIGRVREKALGQEVVGSLTPGQALVGVVYGSRAWPHGLGRLRDRRLVASLRRLDPRVAVAPRRVARTDRERRVR